MTQAKKSTSSRGRASASSRQSAFKEPAALKRLNKSLDAATEALAELRKETGRTAGKSASDLHKELRTLVSGARRYTGRLATTLEREFDRAQKQVTGRVTTATRGRAATSGRRAASTTSRRSSSTSSRRRPSATSGGRRSTRKSS